MAIQVHQRKVRDGVLPTLGPGYDVMNVKFFVVVQAVTADWAMPSLPLRIVSQIKFPCSEFYVPMLR